MSQGKMHDRFSRLAVGATRWAGSYWAFLLATTSIFLWLCVGPELNYSDSWQLIANTGTTIITYLMVFLIQHTQNRHDTAIHIKLDALLEGLGCPELMGIEHLREAEMEERYQAWAEKKASGTPPVRRTPRRARRTRPSARRQSQDALD